MREQARRMGLAEPTGAVPPAPQFGPPPAEGPDPFVLGALLVMFALVIFSNNLRNGLVYDDYPALVQNELTHGVKHTSEVWSTASWWTPSASAKHYRPLPTWTFALNYSCHGLAPRGYHLVNNALHGLTAAVVFLLMVEAGLATWPAFVVGLWFVAHPVHCEPVDWVIGRADVLGGGLLLLSVLWHSWGRRRHWGWTVASVVAFALASLSKETGYLTPFVILAWDLIVVHRLSVRSFWRQLAGGGYWEYLALAATLFEFFVIRGQLVGGATVTLVTPMASPLGEAGHHDRILTAGWVIARYVGLLLWPARLSTDYSPDDIVKLTAVTDPRALLGLLVLLAYAVAAVVACRRSPLAGFALVASAIVLFPGSNLAFPIGTIMAERLLYVPLLAWIVPLGIALDRAAAPPRRKMAFVLAGLLTVGYGVRSYRRAPDWQDEIKLFTSAWRASPRSSMANKNLGAALQIAGRSDEAVPLLQKAIQILPTFPDAHFFLGNCYFDRAQYEDAIRAWRACLELAPQHDKAHLNLGAALQMTGHSREALAEFALAIDRDPSLEGAWYNRVHAALSLPDLPLARRLLAEAVAHQPQSRLREAATHAVDLATKAAPQGH